MADSSMDIPEGGVRRFRPYPRYSESRSDWIGDIPSHWTVARAGDHAQLINGFPFDSERFSLDGGTPLVRIRDLDSDDTEVRYSGPAVESAVIETGDILVGMGGEFNVGRWKGGRALLNQRMCCLRPFDADAGQYLLYSIPFPLKTINDVAYATTVKHLSSNEVRKARLPHPPLREQQLIAAFLDRETAKIDVLVAKKRRLIELLQETRTALITRAVTKGVDPSVQMKDSGVEWLGQIPEHWIASSMRYCTNQIVDGVHHTPDYVDDGVPFVTVRNLTATEEGISFDQLNFISQRDHVEFFKRAGPNPGDILLTKDGTLGVPRVVDTDRPFSIFVSVALIKPDRRIIDSYFLRYALDSQSTKEQSQSRRLGSALQHLHLEQIAGIAVALPPLEEQRLIVSSLKRRLAGITALKGRVGEAIDRLTEFRSALISAAVTGKIDVREEVA
jgi:type I restriction enzyme S subunit